MSETRANVSAVAKDGRAVLIGGPAGSGKSSLALTLIDRGAILIGDDGVTLARAGSRIIASPPPRIAGLIEIRNVGLVSMPTAQAPVSLILRLDLQAPRLPESADTEWLLGLPVPALSLHPGDFALPLRAEHALAIYGLS